MKTINISNDPTTGLERKAVVKAVVITESTIALQIIVNHYKNNKIFTSKGVSSFELNPNTDNNYVNNLGEPVEKETVGAIPERDFLRNLPASLQPSANTEGKIMDIITQKIQSLDINGKFD